MLTMLEELQSFVPGTAMLKTAGCCRPLGSSFEASRQMLPPGMEQSNSDLAKLGKNEARHRWARLR